MMFLLGAFVIPALPLSNYEIGTLIPEVSQIGLGLAFCKMAIEAHSGSITVEDNYPNGSIFTVLLKNE
ncbi:MAG: hypothetical protein RM368_08850 [Nostoc sp. DedSLP03]|uniref:hypothetical protein n=1 Tax=Nostoc sp. DedSLP03 TaxID=3075400 RepID=UPI002AD22B21|nr:hypothetical protein [Nostoc sp. DedSLP03]MDZ7965070.1 hypothetical protein [Nostoc sp. DedSLP03]